MRGGDVAHAELGFFASLLGFDNVRAHLQQIDHPGTAAQRRREHRRGAPRGRHTRRRTSRATSARAGAGTPRRSTPVEQIVDDPYALDELATRIYPTIRSRWRQELLIDRERAGLLADFR